MCGIFGIVADRRALGRQTVEDLLRSLFLLSESRGKEAAGLSLRDDATIHVLKSATPASKLVRSPAYRKLVRGALATPTAGGDARTMVTAIGHSRLVTDGTQQRHDNNQPILRGGAVGVHNGIIVNHESLWVRHRDLERQSEVDSEVIFSLLRKFASRSGSLQQAVRDTFAELEGMASIAVQFDDLDYLLLATNNGSLYHASGESAFVFASERYILEQLPERRGFREVFAAESIAHLRPGRGLLVDLRDLSRHEFGIAEGQNGHVETAAARTRREIVDLSPSTNGHGALASTGRVAPTSLARYPSPTELASYRSMRRCRRCVLPETMPFITFDDEGVCSYCRDYRKLEFYGVDALEKEIAPHRRSDGRPECIVGVSGGRDSCYALHYIVNELGLTPLAYTYDWGMVTDLARRNISRMCGKLGIEHILVSANLAAKRANIRRNVSAWLRRPRLGLIPLFMAGDKQYFYYAQKLKRQSGAGLQLFGENMLERTDFKTGFAGVPPGSADKNHAYVLSWMNKLRLIRYYGIQYLLNPAFLNRSLIDTAFGFASYYMLDRAFLNLFKYIEWHEEEIIPTLLERYDWELATDTRSTWRIGDGTSPFYNYIYLTIAGLTENDTFRSNQIREGLITREEALRRVEEESQPRWDSIRWYLDTIGLGHRFDDVIERINRVPKLYERSGS